MTRWVRNTGHTNTGWIHCFHRLHTTCGLQLSHAWLKFGFDVHPYPYLPYWHTHCLSALLPCPLIVRIQSLWLLIQILSSTTKAFIKCSNCILFHHIPITTSAVVLMTSEADMLLSVHEEHKRRWQHGHCQAAQEHKHFCCQTNLWHTCWHDFTKHVKNSTIERMNHFCGHSAHQMWTIHPKENAAWFQKERTSFGKEHGVTVPQPRKCQDHFKDRLSQNLLAACHPFSTPVLATCTCGMHQEMQVIHIAGKS